MISLSIHSINVWDTHLSSQATFFHAAKRRRDITDQPCIDADLEKILSVNAHPRDIS